MYKRKYLLPSLIILSFFLLICINLLWLGIALSLFVLIVKMTNSVKVLRTNTFLYIIVYASIVMVISVFCRLFIFEIYTIPSNSMEDALFPGDKVLVSKLHYGPKLPQSAKDIPWINLFFSSKSLSTKKYETPKKGNNRLSGFSQISYGDMVVFKRTANKNDFLAKRCMGLSGDTFEIINSKVILNGQVQDDFPTVKRTYDLLFLRSTDIELLSEKWHFEPLGKSLVNNYLKTAAVLNQDQLDGIKKAKGFIDAHPVLLTSRSYPRNDKISWTVDNMGPFVIPKQGMTVVLDSTNYILYERIIAAEKGFPLIEKENKYYIGGRRATFYTFGQNYYFMLGDNKYNSKDSRYWGFVPEGGVVGKLAIILF